MFKIIYTHLSLTALVPFILSLVLYLLGEKTAYKKLPEKYKKIIAGVLFGIAAIIGNEFGITTGGATLNTRDAAPICAGLIFGAPSGIIAGFIGGIERWFSVYWGGGEYARLACSLSTVLAGLFAAFLRKAVFDDKRPSFVFGIVTGVVTETMHLTILFISHISDPTDIFTIVKLCTAPMIICNSAAVGISLLTINILSNSMQSLKEAAAGFKQRLQFGLLITVILCFLGSEFFVYSIETACCKSETEKSLSASIDKLFDAIQEKGGVDNDIFLTSQTDKIFIIADKKGNVVTASEEYAGQNLGDYDFELKNSGGELFESDFDGADFLVCAKNYNNLTIIAMTEKSIAFNSRDNAIIIVFFAEVLVLAGIFLMVYTGMQSAIKKEITAARGVLGKMIQGSINSDSDGDEFTTITKAVHKFVEGAATKIEKDLALARDVQQAALTSSFPAFPNEKAFDIYAVMKSAKDVGGDFYDLFMPDDKHIIITVADISGKGIPAAMFMLTAKSLLRDCCSRHTDPGEAFCEANNALCKNNTADMFVTAWMALIDKTDGSIRFCNAGHNPPVIIHKNGEAQYLRTKPNLVLACIEDMPYITQTQNLSQGDRLLLYTDGVTEAEDAAHNQYGEDRLIECVTKNSALDCKSLVEAVEADIFTHTNGNEQSDDITILIFDYFGEE